MKTHILLLRHGQSVANVEHFFAGQTDIPLTELGRKQARLAAGAMKKIHIDKIFASPLSRAVETAEPFAEHRGLDVNIDSRFIEWHAGKWEGINFDDIKTAFPEEYYYWKNDISHLHMPGGEDAHTVRERMGKALDSLAEANPGLTLLVACHGGVIKTVPSYYAGLDDEVFNKTHVPSNCSVTEVVFENGKGRVERYSDDSHLADLKSEAFIL